ncbi:MAG TPA: hypothetical protein VFV72_04510 [Candidatus Limnocylindrales bacterium]|nr:hypothetical protein [Candidatus Limnocylindrales bacterium]
MIRHAVIVIIVLDVVLLLAGLGPAMAVKFTGRPLSVDCGELDPVVCDTVWRARAATNDGSTGPIVAVQVVGSTGMPTICWQVTISRWWFVPSGYWEPLC